MAIRENGEWLRYVFWGCALGLALLAIQNATATDPDTAKIIASILGVLLFGFSGVTFKTHVVFLDPHRREIVLTHRGLRNTAPASPRHRPPAGP